MKQDEIDIEILPDGTVKTTTPKISAANHSSAHSFMHSITDLLGGAKTAKKRTGMTHAHEHEHTHDQQKAGQ
jgi:hypothetical protein